MNLPKMKIKKPAVHETKGTGNEPEWIDIAELDTADYLRRTYRAVYYYDYHYSRKEGAEWFRMWFKARYPNRKQDLKLLNAVADCWITTTMCAMLPMALRGWEPNFQIMRSVAKSMRIVRIKGAEVLAEKAASDAEKVARSAAPVMTIQDHMREQVVEMVSPIDDAIDAFIRDPEKWDAKQFGTVVNVLKANHCKAAQARLVKKYFARQLEEYVELHSGKVDEQLAEGYACYSKRALKKMYDFLQSVNTACDQIIGERVVLRKPRAKKTRPATDLVKNVKFKISDDMLGIVSVPPTSIIGASAIVVYNVRVRKLGVYYAANVDSTGAARDGSGLSIRGTTLTGFDEAKSQWRMLRKPAELLKKAKDAGTLKKFENFYSKEIKTTESAMSGRLTEDTVILKAFK